MYILESSSCTGGPYSLLIGIQRIQFFIPGARFPMNSRMPKIPLSDGGMQFVNVSRDGISSRIAPTSGRCVTGRTEDRKSVGS